MPNTFPASVAAVSAAIITLAATGTAPGAAPAPNPDRAAAADPWFARAVAELPEVRTFKGKLPDGYANILSEANLVIMLVQARGSEADRELARAVALRYEKMTPADDTPMKQLEPVFNAAMLYLHGGDKTSARRLLPEIKTRAAAVDKGFEAMVVQPSTLYLRALLGDVPDEEAVKSSFGPAFLAQLMANDGFTELARRYAGLARRRTDEAGPEDRLARRMLPKALAAAGDFAGAREVARTMSREQHDSATAWVEIAEARHAAGGPGAAGECLADLRSAHEAAKAAVPENRLSELHMVLLGARRVKDDTALGEVVASFEAELLADAKHDPCPAPGEGRLACELATAYAALSRRHDFDRVVARIESTLEEEKPQDRATTLLRLAGAYGRAGDKVRAADAIARSKAAFKLDDSRWLEDHMLPEAYLEAGDLDAAIAACKEYSAALQKSLTSPIYDVAAALARAGRFADAERESEALHTPFRRIAIHRLIAMERVSAGKLDGLDRWIDGHELPHERVLLRLAVGQRLLGVPDRGNAIIFRRP